MKKSIGARPLIYPTPSLVVGTYDQAGKANAMTAAWAGICCSQPPCVGVCLRRVTYTYGNIIERKAFTLNIPSEDYVKETDYFGIKSGKAVDKFSATGLTPEKSALVDAPYVKEFPINLECKVLQNLEIGSHVLFVAEIMDIKAEESVLGENGIPLIEKVKPVLYAPGVSCYFGVGENLGKAFTIGMNI